MEGWLDPVDMLSDECVVIVVVVMKGGVVVVVKLCRRV